jgi:hypothetical protein
MAPRPARRPHCCRDRLAGSSTRTGIAKRLAIYLAAHFSDFRLITRHTERFVVSLTAQLYEEFGITAPRERDRRASLARAATDRGARRLALLAACRRARR